MTHYFLTVPHDSATEPTMESMQDFDPANSPRSWPRSNDSTPT